MSKIGTGELLVILLVALLIFGPSKLPALGKMAGKAIGTIRHYTDADNWEEFLSDEDDDEEEIVKPKKKAKKAVKKTKQPEADEEETAEDEEEDAAEQTEKETA